MKIARVYYRIWLPESKKANSGKDRRISTAYGTVSSHRRSERPQLSPSVKALRLVLLCVLVPAAPVLLLLHWRQATLVQSPPQLATASPLHVLDTQCSSSLWYQEMVVSSGAEFTTYTDTSFTNSTITVPIVTCTSLSLKTGANLLWTAFLAENSTVHISAWSNVASNIELLVVSRRGTVQKCWLARDKPPIDDHTEFNKSSRVVLPALPGQPVSSALLSYTNESHSDTAKSTSSGHQRSRQHLINASLVNTVNTTLTPSTSTHQLNLAAANINTELPTSDCTASNLARGTPPASRTSCSTARPTRSVEYSTDHDDVYRFIVVSSTDISLNYSLLVEQQAPVIASSSRLLCEASTSCSVALNVSDNIPHVLVQLAPPVSSNLTRWTLHHEVHQQCVPRTVVLVVCLCASFASFLIGAFMRY